MSKKKIYFKFVWKSYISLFVIVHFQNVLTQEGAGFKIAMGAFDKTRPPVRPLRIQQLIAYFLKFLPSPKTLLILFQTLKKLSKDARLTFGYWPLIFILGSL